MVEMMIFSRHPSEIPEVERVSKDLAARLTEEHWRFHSFDILGEARNFIESAQPLDIICTDVTGTGNSSCHRLQETIQECLYDTHCRWKNFPCILYEAHHYGRLSSPEAFS